MSYFQQGNPVDNLTQPSAEVTVSVQTINCCGYCQKPLTGKRPQARYCSPSHRVLGCRKRKQALTAAGNAAIQPLPAVNALAREKGLTPENLARLWNEHMTPHGFLPQDVPLARDRHRLVEKVLEKRPDRAYWLWLFEEILNRQPLPWWVTLPWVLRVIEG